MIPTYELATPMNGLSKSASFKPTARNRLRCGALSYPFFTVSLRMRNLRECSRLFENGIVALPDPPSGGGQPKLPCLPATGNTGLPRTACYGVGWPLHWSAPGIRTRSAT